MERVWKCHVGYEARIIPRCTYFLLKWLAPLLCWRNVQLVLNVLRCCGDIFHVCIFFNFNWWPILEQISWDAKRVLSTSNFFLRRLIVLWSRAHSTSIVFMTRVRVRPIKIPLFFAFSSNIIATSSSSGDTRKQFFTGERFFIKCNMLGPNKSTTCRDRVSLFLLLTRLYTSVHESGKRVLYGFNSSVREVMHFATERACMLNMRQANLEQCFVRRDSSCTVWNYFSASSYKLHCVERKLYRNFRLVQGRGCSVQNYILCALGHAIRGWGERWGQVSFHPVIS